MIINEQQIEEIKRLAQAFEKASEPSERKELNEKLIKILNQIVQKNSEEFKITPALKGD